MDIKTFWSIYCCITKFDEVAVKELGSWRRKLHMWHFLLSLYISLTNIKIQKYDKWCHKPQVLIRAIPGSISLGTDLNDFGPPISKENCDPVHYLRRARHVVGFCSFSCFTWQHSSKLSQDIWGYRENILRQILSWGDSSARTSTRA